MESKRRWGCKVRRRRRRKGYAITRGANVVGGKEGVDLYRVGSSNDEGVVVIK